VAEAFGIEVGTAVGLVALMIDAFVHLRERLGKQRGRAV